MACSNFLQYFLSFDEWDILIMGVENFVMEFLAEKIMRLIKIPSSQIKASNRLMYLIMGVSKIN